MCQIDFQLTRTNNYQKPPFSADPASQTGFETRFRRVAGIEHVENWVETPGFEPGASYMRSKRSTAELRPLMSENCVLKCV